jgi:hypothetical protein
VDRCDGDTLVVTSAGFNDKTWLDYNRHPAHRGAAHHRAVPPQELRRDERGDDLRGSEGLRAPVDDLARRHVAADTELLEYVCNENEKSVSRFLITNEDREGADQGDAVARRC